MRRDDGSALVEFTWLAVMLMVPLVYVLLAVFRVESAAFGVAEAARQAGRALARAGHSESALVLATRAADLAMADQGATAGVDVQCLAPCTVEPGGSVAVRVRYVVQLPLLGSLFAPGRGGIAVSAVHVAAVDRFR